MPNTSASRMPGYATALAVPLLLLLLAACDASRATAPGTEPPPGPGPIPPPGGTPTEPVPIRAPVRLAIPTYDGSGQVVHPDVLTFATAWHGATHWMAVTPYPGGNASFENPSIVAGGDGLGWAPPGGLTNPVVRQPPGGYNSDPDLVYDAAGDRLVLLYREVRDGRNVIRTTASPDGRQWGAPSVLMSRPNHGAISPAVALGPHGRPMLWYVDGGVAGCSASETKVRLRIGSSAAALVPGAPDEGWSGDVETTLGLAGRVVWHLDVIYAAARAEYWAVFHAYDRGKSCGSGDLYFARSRDGVTWTAYDVPILKAGGNDWTEASLYRASVVHDAARDVLRVWFSARSAVGAWSAGYVEFPVPALLRALVGEAAN